VAVTEDNQQCAVSGSFDHTLRLWDLSAGNCICIFNDHTHQINAVVVTSDGQWAISASDDHTLRVWDLREKTCKYTWPHEGKVKAVAVTKDGQCVSGSWDKTLKLWDLKSGKLIEIFQGHEDKVNAVAVTPDGQYAISGCGESYGPRANPSPENPYRNQDAPSCGDSTLRVWDLKNRTPLYSLPGHSNTINAVMVTADGQYVASASDDCTLKIWNLKKGQLTATFYGDTAITCIGAVGSQKFIAGSGHGAVHLLRLQE
jgi:WD40 repeat protein